MNLFSAEQIKNDNDNRVDDTGNIQYDGANLNHLLKWSESFFIYANNAFYVQSIKIVFYY